MEPIILEQPTRNWSLPPISLSWDLTVVRTVYFSSEYLYADFSNIMIFIKGISRTYWYSYHDNFTALLHTPVISLL